MTKRRLKKWRKNFPSNRCGSLMQRSNNTNTIIAYAEHLVNGNSMTYIKGERREKKNYQRGKGE